MGKKSKKFRIAMRMQGMWPHQLAGYESHRRRDGGDVGHSDPNKRPLNRLLIGEANWAQTAWNQIAEMRFENFLIQMEGLKKRRHKSDLKQLLREGPKDPWRASKHGPMREVILTTNKKWFALDMQGFLDESGPTLEQQFEDCAIGWLKHAFGDDCIHARADVDEETYHIHAVVMPRTKLPCGKRMLQPSIHPVIASYEKGQDDVGDWFKAVGLKRGKKRKRKLRKALEHNRKAREAFEAGEADTLDLVSVPKKRCHVSPRVWREKQERKLAERDLAQSAREDEIDAKEASVVGREMNADQKAAQANATLSVARDVAEGRVVVGAGNASGSGDEKGSTSASPTQRLFGRALEVLRAQAGSEARAELKDAFDEIRLADDAIVEIASGLGTAARNRIANARKSLSRAIISISRKISRLPDAREEPPEKD
ncbi:MAG: plasmid recombination protein [Rhodobacteraceae bacterium]|uniref:plasmid recombination protein n=1 Tax=Salipiger sp. HF18 TaxID=2721557 RepID=UPI00142E2C59|nr:plasmid recombination protein [Salipiger sp. HF18]NIY95970.1 hypothetical protein [Salipiger sp. HF18]NVK61819.1 plasmid recombination protein [Paracoccaceae bacterium]